MRRRDESEDKGRESEEGRRVRGRIERERRREESEEEGSSAGGALPGTQEEHCSAAARLARSGCGTGGQGHGDFQARARKEPRGKPSQTEARDRGRESAERKA